MTTDPSFCAGSQSQSTWRWTAPKTHTKSLSLLSLSNQSINQSINRSRGSQSIHVIFSLLIPFSILIPTQSSISIHNCQALWYSKRDPKTGEICAEMGSVLSSFLPFKTRRFLLTSVVPPDTAGSRAFAHGTRNIRAIGPRSFLWALPTKSCSRRSTRSPRSSIMPSKNKPLFPLFFLSKSGNKSLVIRSEGERQVRVREAIGSTKKKRSKDR